MNGRHHKQKEQSKIKCKIFGDFKSKKDNVWLAPTSLNITTEIHQNYTYFFIGI